ncbi:MAG: metallophosphoesterase [Propionicimonas sp.]|uniref:metallophosphoesterase family protein n=1 Tax=Propionicimonas sp. TaxID=1955623 RepID=UPI003D14BED8
MAAHTTGSATPSRRTVLRTLGGAGLAASGLVAGCAPEAPATSGVAPTATPSATPTTSATPVSPAGAVFRFATASDGHLGQPGTDSRRDLSELVAAVNDFAATDPLEFLLLNGDIGHGGVALQEEARSGLDDLAVPYFVTQGNHDKVSAAQWTRVWGTPGNFVQRFGHRSIIGTNTSNLAGDYLCADTSWLRSALAEEAGQSDVFVFMHITPNTWTTYGIDCQGVRDVLAAAPNLRAVFNGHDHDQTGVKVDQGVSYVFDARYGGNWGTPYRAFRVVEVEGRQLRTRLVTTTGRERETLTLEW